MAKRKAKKLTRAQAARIESRKFLLGKISREEAARMGQEALRRFLMKGGRITDVPGVVLPSGKMKVGDKVTIETKMRGKNVTIGHVITRVADGVAIGVPEYMERGAQTYRDRQKQYGDNYKNYGTMMQGLFPNGLTISSREDWNRLGIIHNCVTKLGRYCNNIHTGHQDSAHDLGVYAFMLRELTP